MTTPPSPICARVPSSDLSHHLKDRENLVMTEPTGRILIQRDGKVGWLTISNPTRHNAISLSMWIELGDGLAALEADPDIRVLVLRGAGESAFASGADISRFEEERATPAAVS